MAAFLRASFQGLRRSRLALPPSLSPQRELLKPPESSYLLWRYYGETAAVEETCSSSQATSETTVGESQAVIIQGEDSSKEVDAQGSVKKMLTLTSVEQKHATSEPSSTLHPDKLASLIIGKMKSRNNLNSSKDNAAPLQTDSAASSMTNKYPEGSGQPTQGDRWKQIMNSMRNTTAKKQENLPSGGGSMSSPAKAVAGDNQDDFADLDLPPAQGEATDSKVPTNFQSAIDAFKNLRPNTKAKENGIQSPQMPQQKGFTGFQGLQQKSKEEKPVSFSFLKSLDAAATTSGVAEEEKNNANSSKPPISNQRSPSSNLQSFFQAKAGPLHEANIASSLKGLIEKPSTKAHEGVKRPTYPGYTFGGPLPEAESALSHESNGAFSFEGLFENPSTNAHKGVKRTTYPGYTVCIQNLPSQSNLALAKETLSCHGEILSSFKKQNGDGSCHAFIQFKTAEAMDGALASRWVIIDSKSFRIARADVPFTTVVRLSKVKAETTESQLTSICENFGGVDVIKKRGNGVYDVYYKVNELSNMSTILDSLNEVIVDQSRLLALPAPHLHPAMRREILKGSQGQAWHASQLSQTLERIEGGLDMVSVCLEDLKSLTAMEDKVVKN